MNYMHKDAKVTQAQASEESGPASNLGEYGSASLRSGHSVAEEGANDMEQDASLFVCDKELMLMTDANYHNATRLRLLGTGEAVELLSPPVVDDESGFTRVKVQARRDGLTSFVTYRGLAPHRVDGGGSQRLKPHDGDAGSLEIRDREPSPVTAEMDAGPSPSEGDGTTRTRRFGAFITFSGFAGGVRRCWNSLRRAAQRCGQPALCCYPRRGQKASSPTGNDVHACNDKDPGGAPRATSESSSDSEKSSSCDLADDSRAWFVAGRRRKRARSWGKRFRHPETHSLSPRLTSNDLFSADR